MTDVSGLRRRIHEVVTVEAFEPRPSSPHPDDPERPTWVCPLCAALTEEREMHVRWHDSVAVSMERADDVYWWSLSRG
jgi:hypothetical protein